MGRIIQPARMPFAAAPEVTPLQYTTGQAFIKGAVLVYDSGGNAGNVIEGAANPTPIVGIALEAPASKPGFSVNFDSTVVARTGTVTKVSVAKANRITVFSARMVNGGTDPVVPANSDIGAKYGILRTGATEWVINQADTVNTRVEIIAIDATLFVVLFRFLEANLAQP
jgi:hypothetical protein